MSETIIEVQGLSKRYELGSIGTGTLYGDVNRFWAKIQGKADPYSIIGATQSSKNQNEFWALNDINFTVNEGDVLGIIGRNGAGKSTLLKILSRTTSPTKGKIKIYGRVASLLEVGTGFHPELTGRENIFLNGTILGMKNSEIKAKFDEIVDFAGVDKFIDTPVKRYSSGMYVRLAFAVAAHLEPEILIVDEVLAVGDAEFQRKCIGKMEDVSRNGRTVLFVSHNMGAVEKLCKTGLFLQSGQVKFIGSAADTIAEYLESDPFIFNNISERKDRRGNQLVKLTQLKLFDLNGNQIVEPRSGDGLEIHFEYEIDKSYDLPDGSLYFNIIISSIDDVKLVQHHNRLTKQVLKDFIKSKKVIFSVNELPLVEGDYKLSVALLWENIYLDELDPAIPLKITAGDFHNYKEMPSYSHGKLLVKADWKIEH